MPKLAVRRTILAALLAIMVFGPALDSSPARAQQADALPPIERLVVHKAARTMLAYAGGQVVHTFEHIQLGDAPIGPKQYRGDERTPEGAFVIDYGNPNSAYHLSLHISYPDPAARAAALRAGRSPGGDIFIHGQPNDWAGPRIAGDWTDGCIALSNDEIELLWAAVADGTPIEIGP